MARIATDPNYNSPTFPRATAGTDLFLKEDLQALAAAVSTHVHDGAGKGLQVTSVPLTAIPDGSITSAKIADGTIVVGDIADGAVTSAKILDGTIATADIAADAATQLIGQYLTAPSFSTTAVGSFVVTTVTTGSIACSGAKVRITCSGSLQDSASVTMNAGVMLDGTALYSLTAAISQPNWPVPFSFDIYLTPSAGNHTFALCVQQSGAGTLTLTPSVTHALYVTEHKR